MPITRQQDEFCRYIVEGMTGLAAYAKAYPRCKASTRVLTVKASKLAQTPPVAERIRELRAELAERTLWTRERACKVLLDVIEADDASAQDIVRAARELNLMHGYHAPQKVAAKLAAFDANRFFAELFDRPDREIVIANPRGLLHHDEQLDDEQLAAIERQPADDLPEPPPPATSGTPAPVPRQGAGSPRSDMASAGRRPGLPSAAFLDSVLRPSRAG